ncbi:MAG: WbqC family protein [Candidatus Omnitrophica bacterium]|nr:WbqC family protein [Candidatus Omnitrophota bacterium]
MDQVDVFVLLDDVQYKKNEWQNRNKIRNAESWQWITVPVIYEFGQLIKDIKIDNHGSWRSKHLKSIELNYSHAPFLEEHLPCFKETLSKEWELLADINIEFIHRIKEALGISTELCVSSSMNIQTASTERLVDICKGLKADTYLAGAGGAEYMDVDLFKKNGIGLEFQNYTHPKYPQAYKGFQPNMAVIDLLFCRGKESLDIIREGRGK